MPNECNDELLPLFERWINGDKRVEGYLFSELKRRFLPVCKKFTSDEFLVEEAFQNGTITAFKNFKSYRGENCLSAWLYSIYKFATYDKLRETQRNRKHILFDSSVISGETEKVEYEFFEEPNIIKGRKYISSIPEEDKQLLFMRAFDRVPFEKIAEKLNICRSSVMRRYYKYTEKLLKL